MGVCTKLATQKTLGAPLLPASEIALFRYACGVLCLLALARITSTDLLGRDRIGLLWRGISGGIASTAFFIGIQATSLTHATLLNNSYVIWASIFAIFTLGERLRMAGFASVLAALAGVALVTNPAFGHVRAGDVVSLFSGIMAGVAVVQVRKLRRSESSLAVFFYFNLIGLPIALASILPTHTQLVVPAPAQWLVLAGVGITSVGGQLLMTLVTKSFPRLKAASSP
jgi:drug/metabolite transporter (DMT)-like permease